MCCYMMSKQQYFGSKYGNADPHLMFWFPKTDDKFWGAGLSGSPVYVHQYFPEPITESVSFRWLSESDGTAATGNPGRSYIRGCSSGASREEIAKDNGRICSPLGAAVPRNAVAIASD